MAKRRQADVDAMITLRERTEALGFRLFLGGARAIGIECASMLWRRCRRMGLLL